MSEDEFSREVVRGGFILAWQAHGLCYGIPTSIVGDLRAGEVAVVNGSRTIVPEARRKLPRAKVALITAPKAVLAARLRARGRDEDVEARLARDLGQEDEIAADVVIDNGGTVEASVDRFCAFLREC